MSLVSLRVRALKQHTYSESRVIWKVGRQLPCRKPRSFRLGDVVMLARRCAGQHIILWGKSIFGGRGWGCLRKRVRLLSHGLVRRGRSSSGSSSLVHPLLDPAEQSLTTFVRSYLPLKIALICFSIELFGETMRKFALGNV